MRNALPLLLAAAQALFLASCASPEVEQLTRPPAAGPLVGTLLNPDKLTEGTRDYLQEENLYAVYRQDLAEAIAAPHRGSDIATSPIGTLGSELIKFPIQVITVEPIPEIAGMTELGRFLATHRPDGIWALKPNAPGLMAVLDQPVRKGVTIHSVVGRHHPEDSSMSFVENTARLKRK